MVIVKCPKCAARYRVPEKLVNRKIKCTNCGEAFRIPTPSA